MASVSRSTASGRRNRRAIDEAEVRQRDPRGHEVDGRAGGRVRPRCREDIAGDARLAVTFADGRGPGQANAEPRPGDDDASPEEVEDEVTSPGGERDKADRGITDFVRRAVSAGVGAASRSKDDIMRVAAGEMRTWLEHLNLNEELAKALTKLVIEVKTEIRFRPTDDGKLAPETTNDVKVKPGK